METEDFSILLENALKAWRIKQITEGNKYSIKCFAEYLGISRSIVSMWLNGQREPNLESVRTIAPKLAEILGPYIYDELGLQRPEPVIKEMHKIIDKIPPEEQAKIIKMIREWAADHGYQAEEQSPESDQENEL